MSRRTDTVSPASPAPAGAPARVRRTTWTVGARETGRMNADGKRPTRPSFSPSDQPSPTSLRVSTKMSSARNRSSFAFSGSKSNSARTIHRPARSVCTNVGGDVGVGVGGDDGDVNTAAADVAAAAVVVVAVVASAVASSSCRCPAVAAAAVAAAAAASHTGVRSAGPSAGSSAGSTGSTGSPAGSRGSTGSAGSRVGSSSSSSSICRSWTEKANEDEEEEEEEEEKGLREGRGQGRRERGQSST